MLASSTVWSSLRVEIWSRQSRSNWRDLAQAVLFTTPLVRQHDDPETSSRFNDSCTPRLQLDLVMDAAVGHVVSVEDSGHRGWA
eukprot:m.102903 g.102903  ORF g.102903 m.102903 type:complete len:84 (-) comp20840_c1_seq1:661-912(-)